MGSFEFLKDFIDPIDKTAIAENEIFTPHQIGYGIRTYEKNIPDLEDVDIIIIGCAENRGADPAIAHDTTPDVIRQSFYALYHWHSDVTIADMGNIKQGRTLADSYAALTAVIKELLPLNKKIIILGGSHDLTLPQYQAYAALQQIIEVACIDACIDMEQDATTKHHSFLLDMLTVEPNYIKHYNHLAFQSYFVHPHLLETIDKLRLDCYRLGKVKEHMEDMEPVLRHTHLLSIDISAIQHSYAPANTLSPNGLTGEEMCTLMQYAGMSNMMSSIGIYGFRTDKDTHHLTSKQIAQMLWYYMDGMIRGKLEANLEHREDFNEFHVAFAEVEAHFLQSKRTGRWWMQLPNTTYIPCSYYDYLKASQNGIPERWLRAQERGSF